MELVLGASLAGVGYLLNNDKEQNNIPKTSTQNGPATMSRRMEQSEVSSQVSRSRQPLESNVIPPHFNQNIYQQDNSQTVQFVARPDATRGSEVPQSTPLDSLQTGNQRSFNPPGLQPQTSENFTSQLSGQTMNGEEFTHNNMVPFFGSRIRQNVETGGGQQARLETFTGVRQNDIKHEEIKPMFKPEMNMSHVFGTPNSNDVLMDRYTPSRMRTNEAPVEKINVGPGLNQGFESRPSGGFHQDTRDYALPKSTNELRVKTNPKQSYEGRILPGQGINRRGQFGKMRKNNPDRYYLQNSDRWIKTTGAVKGKALRAPIVDKHTNRQDTTCNNYSGPAGSVERKKAPKPGLFRKSRNQNYHGSGPRNVAATDQWKNTRQADYGKSTMEVAPTERQTTEARNPLSNVTGLIKAITAPVEDIFKTTRKENFVGSIRPTGNLQYSGPKKLTVYDPNDVARTTIKETNIHNNHEGNLRGPNKLIAYDPNDYARTTIKETNIHDNRTGPISTHAYKSHVFDPNDTARTTIKETNIHDVRTGNMSSSASNLPDGSKRMGVVKDPNDLPNTTVRETLPNQDPNVNLGPQMPPVPPVKDPTDVTRTTIKETNIHDNRLGNVTGLDSREGYTQNPKTAPNTNRQSTSNYEYMGQADGDVGKGGGKGYMTNKKEAPVTHRQSTSDHEYSGIADGPEQPKSYNDIYNATLNEVKEELSQGRMPTLTGSKTATGGDMINVQVDKLESDRINQRKMQGDRVSQVIQNIDECTMTTTKNQVPNQPITDRIDPTVLEIFEKNPYTQPLNSAPNANAVCQDETKTNNSAINNANTLDLPAREEEDQIAEARRQAMQEWEAQQSK